MAIHRGRISDATKAKYNQIRYNVRQLNDNTEDTRQQMSYREYRDQLEQGITPRTSKIQQTVEPDMASDAMASYAQYKNTQGAQLANYDLLSDDVKNKLSELTEMEDTNNTGLFHKTDDGSGIFGYKFDPNWKANDIAQDLEDNYGIDSDSLDTLKKVNRTAKKRDTVNAIEGDGYYENALQKNAQENYVRTYPEEIEYATSKFADATDDVDALRADINSYNSTASQKAEDYFTRPTLIQSIKSLASGENSNDLKQQIMEKYNLTDEQFEDLAYYGKELDDYDNRVEQQEKAQAAVNTGSAMKNIAGGAANSAVALVTNPAGGIQGVAETAKYYAGRITGTAHDKHSPLNVNSAGFAPSNATSDLQSATQSAVSNWNKFAGMAYGAGMSAAESLETGMLAPGGAAAGAGIAAKLGAGAKATSAAIKAGQAIASLTPFGANAFASKLSENVSSGQEMDEAMTDAMISAGIEVGTELLPFDHFWDVAKGNSRTARKVLVNFIVQSGLEGAEEYAGDWADRIIDDIRHGDKSDFNQSVQAYMNANPNMSEEEARSQAEKDFMWQTLEDFATGAMSGAMGGAGATVLSIHNTNQSANELLGGFKQQDYANFAEKINTSEDEYVSKSALKSMHDAKSLAEKYATQDKVSAKERRALYYAYTDAITTEEQAEQEKYEREQEEAEKARQKQKSWQDHEAKVDAYNKARGVETEEQTVEQSIAEAIPQELRTEANDSTAGEIHKAMAQAKSSDALDTAIQKGLNSTDENTRKQTLANLDNLAPMLEANGVATESEIQALKQTDAQIYQAGYTGEGIETATTRQKQIYNAGQQAAIEARSASNLEQRELMTQNAASIKNEDGRKLYTDAYQTGMNAQSFDRIANTVMAAGRNGMSLDNAMDKVGADLVTVGGDEQALRSSLEGLYSHAQQQAKNDAVTEAAKALRMRSGVQRFGTGTVTDKRKDQSVALPEMRMIEAFAQMTGVDYYIADEDYEIDGKRIFDGETQGYYSPSDSTIYLNVNERGQLAGTSIHEGFVEFASVWASEETAAVTKALHASLIDSLGTSKYNDLLRAYRNSYAGETNKTDADLDKEILADMAPVLLSNKESLTKFVDTIDKNSTPKEARTIKEKLADWLSGLADALRDFLSEFNPTKYQQQVAEAQIQNIEELRDMLIEATAHAVQNYQQAQMESLAEELGIDSNPATIVENVTTAEDAYQIAYDNFSNTVQDIADNQKSFTDKVDNDLAATFIDTARSFKQSVAGDEAKASKVNEVIDMFRDDLFKDEQQNRRVGIRIEGYTPVYDGLGTHNIPHSDTIELGEYSSRGERQIDAYISIGKLTGAINAYEQKFGISDDTVRGYLDDAKKAVNGIQEAMDNGYAGVDGNSVISAEGEYFKSAMKDLKKYALEHVDGFKDGDINNKSTAASLRNIVTWQSHRDDLNIKDLSDEEISMMFGEEKNRYAVPYVRKSRKIFHLVFDEVGKSDIEHDEKVRLGKYSPRSGENEIDVNTSIDTLTNAINAYESGYGIHDDKVSEYLVAAKMAVNDIADAVDNGYAGVDNMTGVVNAAGENYRDAMRRLRSYSKRHVDGFVPEEMDNQKTSNALADINRYQARRELDGENVTDELKREYLAAEDQRYNLETADLHYAKGVNEFYVSANDLNRNADAVRASSSIGAFNFNHDIAFEKYADKYDITDALIELNEKKKVVNNKLIGDISLDNSGTTSYLSHVDDEKALFFNVIPKVLENGVMIAGDQNHRGKIGKNSIVLAARVTMEGGSGIKKIEAGDYYVAVVVRRNVSDTGHVTQGFHAMDFMATKIEDNPDVLGNFVGYNKSLTSYEFLDLHDILTNLSAGVNIYESDSTPQRFSRVIKDTIDRELSEGQQEYFKDSKAVDDNGRLKVMLHGTTSAGFTVFDPAKSDDGTGLFFTDNDYIAGTYSDTSDTYAPSAADGQPEGSRRNYQVYLDLKNPMVVDYEGRHWNEGELRKRDDVVKTAKAANKALSSKGTPYGLERYIDQWINYDNRMHTFETYVESIGAMMSAPAEGRKAVHAVSDMLENEMFQMVTDGAVGADVTDMLFDGTIQYNTRDYVREAKANGYDGVIFKNVIDEGPYSDMWVDQPSTVMVAFNSNQVKSINNENPTDDVDIRKSMKIDDNRNMNNEDISANRDEVAAALEKGKDVLKGTKVNKMAARNIAMEMKRDYDSAYDLEQFTNNLTKLFGYLHSGKSINYNDFVAVMQDVARPVVDAAYTSQASREDYAQFRNGINELSFSLTPEQTKAIKSAFGSMKAFERYYPEIHITEDGKSFAEQWSSLVDLSRGLLDENTDAVDMPTALVDAMEALRPSMNNWEDNTQAAHDMALDIISKYLANYHDDGANKAVINEFVKSAEKEIKASQKEWKSKIKEDYKERLKAERAYQKEIASGRVKRANERSAEQIAKLRAKNATRIGDIRERQKRNHQLQQINKSASKLYQYLTNPTDQNHVPKDLQEPVMQLMASLDMSQPSIRQGEDGKWHTKILAGRTLDEATGRYTYEWKEITADSREDAIRQYNEALADGLGSTGARKWYDRMRDIADMYNKKSGDKAFDESNSQDMMDFLQGLSEDLAEEFDNILKDAAESGKASIAALGSDELKTINKVLANVLQAVNMINKSYSVPNATISEMSEAVIAKANTVKGRRNHRLPVEQAINFFTLSNANMHTFFHAIGADTAIDIIINAQNQKAFILKEAQETSRELLKDFTAKELENMEKDSAEYLNGKVKLTTFQRMDLREILMRPDAASHFAAGIKQGALPGWTNTESVARHLTMDEAWEIVDTLDERYRNLSDGMQQFMARMGSTYGNRTSNLIHGYDKFTDDRYITMQTDSTTHRANTSELLGGVSNSIKNMGMTKAVTGNATNALVINNLSDVYAKHIADMAVYSAWAPAIQDLIRFYNYKQVIRNENGTVDYITTKDAIRKMFGDAGNKYFVKMISDLQRAEQSSFEDPGIISFFTGNAKKAATMANMRVAVQQPTAIMRAGKRIDYKYLNKGITGINGELEKLRKDMIDSDAVYWIKQQGNIDGQITQSLKSQITGIQGWREKVDDKTGWLAGKADQVTWDAMYRACIAEQIDKMGRDKIGTQEFKDAVNYKFDHLMLETQVYDGTITRSQFMRSADKYAGQLSAFMAEPTKTYNIVLSDMIDYMQTGDSEAGRRVAKAALGTTAKVLVITAVANAAAQSFADAFRNAGDPDDEDDLNFIQRFWSAMGWDYDAETWQDQAYALLHGNLADNLYLWNNIPIINDFASSIDATLSEMLFDKSSYSSSDSLESQWLTHLDDWMTATQDLFADKETKDNSTKTKYSYFAKTARLLSDLTGVPVYAAQRDIVAIYNTVVARGISGGSLPVLQKTKTSDKAQAKKDVYNIVREGGSYDEIKEAIDEAVETSNSYDGIKQGIKAALKEEFIALYKSNKSAAGQMKTRIAQIYVYIANKEGTYKDKTDSEKLEMYKKQIDKWLE